VTLTFVLPILIWPLLSPLETLLSVINAAHCDHVLFLLLRKNRLSSALIIWNFKWLSPIYNPTQFSPDQGSPFPLNANDPSEVFKVDDVKSSCYKLLAESALPVRLPIKVLAVISPTSLISNKVIHSSPKLC